MSEFELEVQKLERVLESLEDIQDDLRGGGTVTVGTGVEYAVYLEFGTSDIDPRPFFRPALSELRTRGVEGFLEDNTRLSTAQIADAESLVDAVGLALERRIKEIITQKGLIDTGTLRASILAIPGDDASRLPGEEAFGEFDSDTPAPATAGRAAAQETVEVDL